jgi:hypothetical protein
MVPDRKYANFTHRTGWPHIVEHIRSTVPHADRIDDFVEAAFGWDRKGGLWYDKPWIGIAHNPRGDHILSHAVRRHPWLFMRTSGWHLSRPKLRRLVVLSNHHARQLGVQRFRVEVLTHPTTFGHPTWDIGAWEESRRVVQLGEWLRNTQLLQEIAPKGFNNVVLRKETRTTHIAEEFREKLSGRSAPRPHNVYLSPVLDDDYYDRILASSVMVTEVYDASANNSVLESIARAVPHLINRHPAVMEYMGPDYPGYWERREQIEPMLNDVNRLDECHLYLLERSLKAKFRIENFIRDLKDLSESCLS